MWANGRQLMSRRKAKAIISVFIVQNSNVEAIVCSEEKRNNYYEDSTTGKQNAAKYIIYNGIRTNWHQQLLSLVAKCNKKNVIIWVYR